MKKLIISSLLGLIFYIPVSAQTVDSRELLITSLQQVIKLLVIQVTELQKLLAVEINKQMPKHATTQNHESVQSDPVTPSAPEQVAPTPTPVVTPEPTPASTPAPKSKIDVSVSKGIDFSVPTKPTSVKLSAVIYNPQGKVMDTVGVKVTTDSKVGFNRPSGYTDGQSPTVTDYDFELRNTFCGDNPCYVVEFENLIGHDSFSVTFTAMGVSNVVTVEY